MIKILKSHNSQNSKIIKSLILFNFIYTLFFVYMENNMNNIVKFSSQL